MHNKVGLKCLGRGAHSEQVPSVYIFTKEKVATPYDLAGMRVTGGVFFNPVPEAMGMSVLDMPLGDMYTALERGMFDAVAQPLTTAVLYRLHEQVKYMIDHPLFVVNVFAIANLDKWNSLPEHLQKLVQDVVIEMEPVCAAEFDKMTEGDLETVSDAGIETIEFSLSDAKWYEDLAYRVKWEDLTKANSELAARLRPIIEK